MDLKEEDFEELQSICKYMYIGDHHTRCLCHKYEGWVDCTYNHCPKIMKSCSGMISINGEVIDEIISIKCIVDIAHEEKTGYYNELYLDTVECGE